MVPGLDTFVKELADSGIISSGKLENFLPPKAAPKDADELARHLISQNHLTSYQAEQILQGRAKSLFLGNYTILDVIGAGGMGQVFKAKHRRMERIVAIKMLSDRLSGSALAAARFDREVRAAARLSHPNIVAAYDADEAGGQHFLVMEYVEGCDLSAMVKRQGPFSVSKALDCIVQAAQGLEYAHHKGLIHRDIKPSNLLLDNEGTIKILDMGLARILTTEDDATQAELTGAGAAMGTIDYMSPEQALNTHAADPRSDIYSLGCTLYYLLTAQPIYGGESGLGRIIAHREQAIPSLRSQRHDVSAKLDQVFQRMVAKRPEERFASMSALLDALLPLAGAAERSAANAGTAKSASKHSHTSRATTTVRAAVAKAGSGAELTPRRRWLPLAAVGGLAAIIACVMWITRGEEDVPHVGGTQPAQRLEATPLVAAPVVPVVKEIVAKENATPRLLQGHEGAVLSVAFAPNGKYLATAGGDATIRLWNPSTGVTERVLKGHTLEIHCVAFSADSKQLISASADNSVRLWDVEEGHELARCDGHQDQVYTAALLLERGLAASAGKDRDILLWDTASHSVARRLVGHTLPVWSVVFDRDGEHLYSAGSDQVIRRWQIDSGDEVGKLNVHTKQIMSLVTAAGVDRLASAGLDGTIAIWDGRSSEPQAKWVAHALGVRALAITPSGKYLLSGGLDKEIVLWNVDEQRAVFRAPGHTELVAAVGLSPDLNLAASAGGKMLGTDRDVRLWTLPELD